jgi:hypothetical protein
MPDLRLLFSVRRVGRKGQLAAIIHQPFGA